MNDCYPLYSVGLHFFMADKIHSVINQKQRHKAAIELNRMSSNTGVTNEKYKISGINRETCVSPGGLFRSSGNQNQWKMNRKYCVSTGMLENNIFESFL